MLLPFGVPWRENWWPLAHYLQIFQSAPLRNSSHRMPPPPPTNCSFHFGPPAHVLRANGARWLKEWIPLACKWEVKHMRPWLALRSGTGCPQMSSQIRMYMGW